MPADTSSVSGGSSAPIALFVYNRPEHMQRTVEALRKNDGAKESDLTVFSDGPGNPDAAGAVRRVREMARQTEGFRSVRLVERQHNLGLAGSVIAGVTELCEKHGRVIVVEDDLIASPHFLAYMNEALQRYEDSGKVMQISGYMFPVELSSGTDAVFLPFTTCWGWGTWKRAWRYFDPHMSAYEKIRGDRRLRYRFDLNGSYDYFDMLKSQRRGDIDSWAIRWYLSVFAMGGLTLHPVKSLIENIGFDASGTHCRDASFMHGVDPEFTVRKYPEVAESGIATRDIARFLAGKGDTRDRIMRTLKRWIS